MEYQYIKKIQIYLDQWQLDTETNTYKCVIETPYTCVGIYKYIDEKENIVSKIKVNIHRLDDSKIEIICPYLFKGYMAIINTLDSGKTIYTKEFTIEDWEETDNEMYLLKSDIYGYIISVEKLDEDTGYYNPIYTDNIYNNEGSVSIRSLNRFNGRILSI